MPFCFQNALNLLFFYNFDIIAIMKKILSHHVFSMNFAAIFGLSVYANKPITELVNLLIGRTKEVLGKLEFVPGNLTFKTNTIYK